MSIWHGIGIYLAVVNLAAFLLMGIDKRRAVKHRWRISEKMLFLFPLIGGALGGFLGMLAFRHKTKRWYFRFGLPALLIVQCTALAFFGYVGDYYHADDTALDALQGTDVVSIKNEDNVFFFDGPGEDTALIFYPGAKVEAAAYAPLLLDLAEEGVDCFLVEMPFNMAFFGINRADKVMESHNYAHWYISGHSLGGAMAASYASDHLDSLDGLVLLAAYPTSSLQADAFSVLSVYGSEDGVLNREKLESGAAYMPEDYTEICIEGGNHAWFGSYGEQAGDGQAAIGHQDQWEQAVAAMADLTTK